MYTPVSSRAANAYRQIGVQSGIDGATPHQLVQMLFDGLLQSLNAARGALQRGEIENKGVHIGKAVRILEEGLKGALNPVQGGELAVNLGTLYDYCITRLTMANLRNDLALVEEVVGLVEPVAQGWKEMGQAQVEAGSGGY
ncbi:flagellar export chaperone FliS [Pantoea sp. 18069]|uniref:flagellar export chaperone FliS n=1 Tax=Pantoea sp. 18069 TaxID=2681415 RepID=UPI001358C906|nr:flagellar export chaperone FliS [Pantoea sp. 18069]